MSRPAWIVLIVIAVIALGGLLLSNQMTKGLSNIQVSPETNLVSPSPFTAQEINVSGGEFSFEPNTISAKPGQTIKVNFKNNGKFPHNFTISELNVASQTIQPGQSDTVEFTVENPGTFTYFCSVGSHRANGMEGTLKVE